MSVNTAKVSTRRELRFSSYEELLKEVDRLSGVPTRQLGNWSLGQICDHLAKAMDMAVDGAAFTPPVPIRLIAPFFKKRTLRKMSPGFKLPKRAKALLPPEVTDAEGVAKLKTSAARIQQTLDRKPHGFFGVLSNDEWDQLQFRHAEMHLSFIEPV